MAERTILYQLAIVSAGLCGVAALYALAKRATSNTDDTDAAQLPPAFRFGVATADHQCEAIMESARDIRDLWEERRDETPRGRATDFWHRFDEDIALAAGMGCKLFRLSLAWSRLEPQPGEWDDQAFEHYRHVLTTIHENKMQSVVTLHHNTWPIHVETRGGMIADDFPLWFERYAGKVASLLGDRIDYYVTINEPNQLTFGYTKPWWSRAYVMPPGETRGASSEQQMRDVGKLIRNLFLANAKARKAIKAVHADAKVGANPLVFGLPAWLQRIIDRNATRIRDSSDLEKQGKHFTQRTLLESGAADIVVAQLGMSHERMNDILFSESYFVARPSLLASKPVPQGTALRSWTGRVGVLRSTIAAEKASFWLPRAVVSKFSDISSALKAFQNGEIDAVFADDVLLREYLGDGLHLTSDPAWINPFAVGVAPGNRDLLNAVDAAIRDFKSLHPNLLQSKQRNYGRRATLADLRPDGQHVVPTESSEQIQPTSSETQLTNIQKRGTLRVAVHSGVEGLCTRTSSGEYRGLEPDLARYIAEHILGPSGTAEFIEVPVDKRIDAARSPLRLLDPLLRIASVFQTILNTNWWYLGMAGKLPAFLCPPECTSQLDYVGIDYYWGIRSLGLGRIIQLLAASEQRYARAPVWPAVLYDTLRAHAELFPGKQLMVIENGCVDVASGVTRDEYLRRHIVEVQRAVAGGVPVDSYICWSITSNREWGLRFDQNSNFGLYFIDLDNDYSLKRQRTTSALTYRSIIARRSAN